MTRIEARMIITAMITASTGSKRREDKRKAALFLPTLEVRIEIYHQGYTPASRMASKSISQTTVELPTI
jgi:hypothetical protein